MPPVALSAVQNAPVWLGVGRSPDRAGDSGRRPARTGTDQPGGRRSGGGCGDVALGLLRRRCSCRLLADVRARRRQTAYDLDTGQVGRRRVRPGRRPPGHRHARPSTRRLPPVPAVADRRAADPAVGLPARRADRGHHAPRATARSATSACGSGPIDVPVGLAIGVASQLVLVPAALRADLLDLRRPGRVGRGPAAHRPGHRPVRRDRCSSSSSGSARRSPRRSSSGASPSGRSTRRCGPVVGAGRHGGLLRRSPTSSCCSSRRCSCSV